MEANMLHTSHNFVHLIYSCRASALWPAACVEDARISAHINTFLIYFLSVRFIRLFMTVLVSIMDSNCLSFPPICCRIAISLCLEGRWRNGGTRIFDKHINKIN